MALLGITAGGGVENTLQSSVAMDLATVVGENAAAAAMQNKNIVSKSSAETQNKNFILPATAAMQGKNIVLENIATTTHCSTALTTRSPVKGEVKCNNCVVVGSNKEQPSESTVRLDWIKARTKKLINIAMGRENDHICQACQH